MIEVIVFVLPMFFLVHFLFGAWKNHRGIVLVEDHLSDSIKYYWESVQGKVLSPKFHDLDEAKRWWLRRQYKSFTHKERRQRLQDRRIEINTRGRFGEGSFGLDMGAGGRRRTDHEKISRVIRMAH